MNGMVLTLLTHSVTRTFREHPNNVVDVPMTFVQRNVFAGRHVYAYFHQGFSRLVFQSYQGDGLVIIKGCVQCNPFMIEKVLTSSMARTQDC